MRRAFLASLVVLGTLLDCSACSPLGESGGSNTNWLERCEADSDCSRGQECWCHACTVPCTGASDCGNSSECRVTEGLGCNEPSASAGPLCVASCQNDGDCAASGAGLVCQSGACVREPASKMGIEGDPSASLPVTPTLETFDIAPDHACVVAAGSVYCWGKNAYGQDGEPGGQVVPTPHLVSGLNDVSSIAVSPEHSCALTTKGGVYCWGANDHGQVGSASAPALTCRNSTLGASADSPCQPTPQLVAGIGNAVQVAVSSRRSCALLADHSARCWGDVAALGDWPAPLTNVQAIALGDAGACALSSAGELSCSAQEQEAVQAATSTKLAAIALSRDAATVNASTCFLGADGGVNCAADPSLAQQGIAGSADGKGVLDHIRQIALGAEHACALGADGLVRCWGNNSHGQVGPAPLTSPTCGTSNCESLPQLVQGLPPITAIAAGGNLSCALATDQTLWCWGADLDLLSVGGPLRIAGPWEPHGDACGPFVAQLSQSIDESVAVDRSCTADADCAEVSLNVACDPTCAVSALPLAAAASASKRIARIESDSCTQARALGCAEPVIACATTSATRAACRAGACVVVEVGL